MPSNPSLFFIQFPAPLPPDVEYEPIAADLKTTVPPSNFSKRCGILAPYGAFLYRAEVLTITRSADKQHLYVKVKFVDFGNIGTVDFFKCQSISKQYLYPPKASPCQLYNIRPEEWKGETLDLFRQYLNNSTPQIKARVSEFSDAFKITTIQVWVRGIGDLGELLVVNGVAKWKNQPLEPTFTVRNDSLIGTCDMLYETGGWGDVVKIDVRAIETIGPIVEHFTCTSHFKTESMIDSINTAFIFTKCFLKEKKQLAA